MCAFILQALSLSFSLSLFLSTSAYFNFIDLIILQLRTNTVLTLGLASYCKAVNRFSLHRLLPNKKEWNKGVPGDRSWERARKIQCKKKEKIIAEGERNTEEERALWRNHVGLPWLRQNFLPHPPLTLFLAFSLLLPRMKGCLEEWFHFCLGCHIEFIRNTTYESKNMYFGFLGTYIIFIRWPRSITNESWEF